MAALDQLSKNTISMGPDYVIVYACSDTSDDGDSYSFVSDDLTQGAADTRKRFGDTYATLPKSQSHGQKAKKVNKTKTTKGLTSALASSMAKNTAAVAKVMATKAMNSGKAVVVGSFLQGSKASHRLMAWMKMGLKLSSTLGVDALEESIVFQPTVSSLTMLNFMNRQKTLNSLDNVAPSMADTFTSRGTSVNDTDEDTQAFCNFVAMRTGKVLGHREGSVHSSVLLDDEDVQSLFEQYFPNDVDNTDADSMCNSSCFLNSASA